MGLSLNEDRTFLKCYMGDTGLLISHTFTESEIETEDLYRQLILGRLSINQGMIFENAVMQALICNGYKPFFYTQYHPEKHQNDIEIDFLISNKSKTRYKIYPIEVKSTEKYSISSLQKFIEKFKGRIGQAYVIHTKNFQIKEDIIYLPAYMAMCFKKISCFLAEPGTRRASPCGYERLSRMTFLWRLFVALSPPFFRTFHPRLGKRHLRPRLSFQRVDGLVQAGNDGLLVRIGTHELHRRLHFRQHAAGCELAFFDILHRALQAQVI